MSPDLQGTWILTANTNLSGKIGSPPEQRFTLAFDREQNGQFSGHYIDINDPSIFVAQVFSSQRGTAISIVQSHQAAGYYATYSSYLKSPETRTIQGVYMDLEGRAGDFQLVPSDKS